MMDTAVTLLAAAVTVISMLVGGVLVYLVRKVGKLESKINVLLIVFATQLSKDDVNSDVMKALTEAMKD